MKLDYKILENYFETCIPNYGGEKLLQNNIVSGTKEILKKYNMLSQEFKDIISDYKDEDMMIDETQYYFVQRIINELKKYVS